MKFTFRVARSAPRWRHVLVTTVQTVLMWWAFLVFFPWAIWNLERGLNIPSWTTDGTFFIGLVGLVSGSILGLWSSYTMAWVGAGTPLPMATARHLVIKGPYRMVRNPMAISGLVQGASIGLIIGSWLVLSGVVLGALVWHYWVRPAEEADLAQRFGYEYQHYCQHVHSWLPFFGGKRRQD